MNPNDQDDHMDLASLGASHASLQLQSADPAAIAAAESAKQRLQAAFIMAKQFPRNADQARHRILSTCRRPRFAEKVEYKKPIGEGHIIGPSIRLAEVCMREWGNIMAETNVSYEDETSRRVCVTVIDLETNTRFSKEIRISKTVERSDPKGRDIVSQRKNSYNKTVFLVKASDDELAIKEASAVSKALRNEGLRCIPCDIIEDAIDTARATMSGQFTEDPDAAKKRLLDAFAALRISPSMLADYLGHSTEQISLDEWQDLRALYRGLKEGMTQWRDIIEMRKSRKESSDAKAGPSAAEELPTDEDPTRGVKS